MGAHAGAMIGTAATNIAARGWRLHVIDSTERLPWVARCGVGCDALYAVEQYERMTRGSTTTNPCPKCKPEELPGARQFTEPTDEQYHVGEYVNLVAEHRQSFRLDGARHHVTSRGEALDAAARWLACHRGDWRAFDMRYQHEHITRADIVAAL